MIGSCIGSFLNVVIYRLPKGLDFVRGRSYCPKCHHQLNAIDLIPIFSWILLKGRCRYCRCRISMRYMIIEWLSGSLALLCYYRYGMSYMTLMSFVLSMILLCISVIDIDTMIIPNSLVVCCGILALISLIYDKNIYDKIIGFILISLLMYLINIYKECFGGGDIKLVAMCGFMLGIKKLIVAMYIAFLLAELYAFYLVFLKKESMKQYIPFAPFICIGVYFSMLYGYHFIYYFLY